MEPSLFVGNDGTSFQICLSCGVTGPIINEILKLKSVFPGDINLLELVTLNFHYNTHLPTLLLPNLVEALNYLVGSLILNLEFKFPLVFSFYGRCLFKTNYNWLIRNIDELLAASPPNEVQVSRDKNSVFLRTLKNIQLKILSEYNTLSLMRECDNSSSRIDACRRYRRRLSTGPHSILNTSVKAMVYDLQVFNLQSIENHIGAFT